MLRGMKVATITTSLFSMMLLGLSVGGCATRPSADEAAAEFLGAGPVNVLSNPTRVEGWNFQRPDGSIMSDPTIRPLDLSVAKQLGAILLDGGTYRLPARSGGFAHAVGYRVWRGGESVDVFVSFANDQVQVKSMGNGGQPISEVAGVTAAHDALVGVAKKAFPEFKAK
jgi:hypothetical protein